MSARPRGSGRPKAPAKHDPRRGYARRGRQLPIIPIVALALAGIIAFFGLQSLRLGAPGERIAVTGQGDHRSEGSALQYNSVPPAGGPHWNAVAPWGISTTPVRDEIAVHNLEHGGVVVSHNLIPQADLDRIRALLTSYPRDRYGQVKLLIRPYDGIPAGTFVLAAWGWKQSFSAYDESAVRSFMDAHLNKCCENVP
jgi:hypothetical protein